MKLSAKKLYKIYRHYRIQIQYFEITMLIYEYQFRITLRYAYDIFERNQEEKKAGLFCIYNDTRNDIHKNTQDDTTTNTNNDQHTMIYTDIY